jgi:MFS family permease
VTPDLPGARLLQLGAAISAFDRFVVAALLGSIAADFDVGLGAVAGVAGWYFVCYGVSQPAWGRLSDWLGRASTMRLALALAAAGGVASALAPTLPLLVAVRALTGACMAAVVPAALVYIGDVVPLAARQRTLTDINAATAAGMTAATVLGGLVAGWASWRVAFLLPAVPAAVLVVALRRLPLPPMAPERPGGLLSVLRDGGGRTVLALALVEGFILLGFLAYFAPALESRGHSAGTAGAVVGGYGLGLLLASRVVKRLASSVRPGAFLACGSVGLSAAYATVSLSQTIWAVGAAALAVGGGWAALHSTMQTWATEVVPHSRGSMMSLFAGGLFVGGGIGTATLAPLAGDLDWQPLFLTGTAGALLFGLTSVVLHRRQVPPARGDRAGPEVAGCSS